MAKKNKILIISVCSLLIPIIGYIFWNGKQKTLAVFKSNNSKLNNNSVIIKEPVWNDDETTIHPILERTHRVIGGIVKGKWVDKDEMVNNMSIGEKYKFKSFNINGYIGTYEGSLYGENAPDPYYMVFNTKDKSHFNATFSISGGWLVQPRIPQIYTTNLPKKDNFIQGLLEKNDIKANEVKIKELIKIDLDGDGIEENFYNVSNITDANINDFCKKFDKNIPVGKYSILLIRKKGTEGEKNIIVTEEYNVLYVK